MRLIKQKRIMIINPYFKLRISTKGRSEKASVLCEIKMKGFNAATAFATGVTTLPEKWDYQNQRVGLTNAQARTDNQTLDRIFQEINEIAKSLHYQDKPITPRIIKELYCEKPQKIPNFIQTLDLMLESRKNAGIEITTQLQYESLKRNITEYLERYQKSKIELEQFKNKDWEKMKFENSRNDASNHVLLTFIKSIFKFANKHGFLMYHEINKQDNPTGNAKELIWLDTVHVERLIEHRYRYDHHENLRKAFVFQCYTGLAYEEIKTFKKSVNIKEIGGKKMIMVYRKKTKTFYPVPILKQAKEILEQISDSFSLPGNYEYNIALRFLGEIMQYENIEEITSHKGRVTAGVFLLNNGVPLEVVSKILGHKNIQTTQDYYVTVLTKYIDTSTLHLQ